MLMTILSVDGIGAYNHVLRSVMLGWLLQIPGARQILRFCAPLLRCTVGLTRTDNVGQCLELGGEQGDPLMPLLFAIGIQSALEEVARSLEQESSCVLFSTTSLSALPPSRVQHLHKVLTEALSRHVAIQLHQGKTKTWNHVSIVPENVETFGSQRASQFWAHRLDPLNTFSARWMSASPRSVSCGCPSRQSLICSVHGTSWSKAQILATTPCARCHRPSQRFHCRAHDAGIWDTARELFGTFPAGKRRNNSCPRCRCGWEVWVCGLLNDWQLHFGPLGQTCHDQRQKSRNSFRGGPEARCRRTLLDVWPNSVRHVWHWTIKGFGDPVGLSSERGKDHHKHAHENLVSGLTGVFRPRLLLSEGVCQAHLRSHSGCNAGLALGTPPLLVSSPYLHTFSVCCS